MKNDKWFLVDGDNRYSYGMLIRDLNEKRLYSPYLYIKDNQPYLLFLCLIHSIVNGYCVEVVDGDFSDNELQSLGLKREDITRQQTLTMPVVIASVKELLEIVSRQTEWTMTLYTSGTTGRPKKVTHTLRHLTRKVKADPAYAEHIWALAYNPSHIAGLQVFFQAFLNGNTMIYAFGERQNTLDSLLRQYDVTHISATSTYYRSTLPYLNGEYRGVLRVTCGGEKYDERLEELVKLRFPSARITNIYASTEAGSLFSSRNETFKLNEEIVPFVKFTEDGELMLHKELLGQASAFHLEGEWHKTGDIVELLDDRSFRFISRISDYINVGGYKVNPHEVEQCLRNAPGVIDVAVRAAENKVTGNIIVLDVVKNAEFDDDKAFKAMLKKYAAERLQTWKIPRIIHLVDRIERSRTGKKVRR